MSSKKTVWPVPIVLLGTLLLGIAIYLCLLNTINLNFFEKETTGPQQGKVVGHWLKTGLEKDPVKKTDAPVPSQKKEVPVKEEKVDGLNKTLNNTNILYLWTERKRPKVISVMTMNQDTGKAAIVIMPLFTRINWQGKVTTIEDLFQEGGREAVKDFLQKNLEIKLPFFVNVEQNALVKLSDIIGPFKVDGETMTMADAFEQTALGLRHNDQDIVREVARQTFKPRIILSIPKIIWIFTHDISTNMNTEDMLGLYRLSRDVNLGNMYKVVLPGEETWKDGEKMLLVGERTWKNVMYEVTQK